MEKLSILLFRFLGVLVFVLMLLPELGEIIKFYGSKDHIFSADEQKYLILAVAFYFISSVLLFFGAGSLAKILSKDLSELGFQVNLSEKKLLRILLKILGVFFIINAVSAKLPPAVIELVIVGSELGAGTSQYVETKLIISLFFILLEIIAGLILIVYAKRIRD